MMKPYLRGLLLTDPKKVLAGGFAVLIVLILLIYLSVRYRDKKRRLRQLSERKEEAESMKNKRKAGE